MKPGDDLAECSCARVQIKAAYHTHTHTRAHVIVARESS